MKDLRQWRSKEAESTDWRERAECRHHDPELFFPVSLTGAAAAQIEAARRICARCPVRVPCLRWALDTGQDSGIWGGTTSDERRLLRRVPAPRLPSRSPALL